ncbi:MAG: PilN domain-containing protein [Cyanobacteria bacterium J06635_10]
MYSLDVNFLKDRPVYGNVTEKKPKATLPAGEMVPIYIGVAVAVFFPALLGTVLWFLQSQNANIDEKIAALEQENQQLESRIGSIKKIKQETNTIKSETQALVSVFDQIRPWSAMLQVLRDRVPAKVRIESIKQIAPSSREDDSTNTAGGIEISGVARSFYDVNDFLLSLQQSPFFKSADGKIVTAELVDAQLPDGLPDGAIIKPDNVVKYTITTNLSDVPASELMRELEQKGTVGLVARIRSLQRTGVFEK